MPEIKLSQGTVQYRDDGTGAPIVLIHGLLVAGSVWDRLVPELAPRARVIVPDLPSAEAADLTQAANPALARIFGYQPEELPDEFTEWRRRVPPEDEARIDRAFRDFFDGLRVNS